MARADLLTATIPWYRAISREQWRAFFATFLGWVIDAFDYNILAFVLIDIQKSFTQSLMDSFDRGVGQLVDADMNVESTRLQALQVQQQLGIQALSIANGNSQSILSLFRG